MSQDERVTARSDRKAVVEVRDTEGPPRIAEAELARFEHLAIGLAEHWQQDAALQLGTRRGVPGNVEKGCVRRRRAVLQHVVPPGIFVADNAHVIGHGVEDLSEAVLSQSGDKGLILLNTANLGVEDLVANDVIAVLTAGPGLKVWGGVAVGDAEVAQVGKESRRIAEGEVLVKLKPVGGLG